MRSLYLKLILPSLAVIIGSVVFATALGWRYMEAAAASSTASRAHGLAQQAQAAISHAMRVDANRALHPLLETFAASPDLAAIRILTPAGEVRFSSREGETGIVLPAHVRQRSSVGDRMNDPSAHEHDAPQPIVHTVEPIARRPQCDPCHAKAGPVIALLDVDMRFDRPLAGLAAWRALSASLATLQAIAIVILIVPVVLYTIVLPMRRLKRAMAKVRAGDLTARLEPIGTKEIDPMVADFNSMVQRLEDGARAEAELHREQLDRAEHLATVGELAAGLAHEIRNPLSGVKAAVEVVVRDPASADSVGMLQEAALELGRIDLVVRQLLNYARPRRPSLERTDADGCVAEALVLARGQAAVKSVALVERLGASGARVIVDTEMMRQVVVNLVLNAFQAVDSKDGAQVEVSTASADGMFECRVRDNGPGVPGAQAETIFQPFFTTRRRGTGLGLAISRRLTELNGGRLHLENPGNPGASFVVTLPLAATD